MLLLAFSHSWTKSSKVTAVLVLRNSFPVFPCIASAAMNVWPFSWYLKVIVSGPLGFTHCTRLVNNYQFLSWPLQLSAHSQMWSSLHWQINYRNADATSGALRKAILLCVRECSSLVWVYLTMCTRIFDMVFVAEANLTLVLWRSWKPILSDLKTLQYAL